MDAQFGVMSGTFFAMIVITSCPRRGVRSKIGIIFTFEEEYMHEKASKLIFRNSAVARSIACGDNIG